MEFCSQMKQCCTYKKSYLNNSLEKIPKPATLLYLQH